MPILSNGLVVGITSERARYHATRQNIRITRETPREQLHQLVDIIYADAAQSPEQWHKQFKFTGYTLSDRLWLSKWRRGDRESFLDWLGQESQIQEIEGARRKIIYDTLPHLITTHDYPQRLYSTLQLRLECMNMATAPASQWRNTLLNMSRCGVRLEELRWSGVLAYLDEEIGSGDRSISRSELVSRIDFSDIRLELTHELTRSEHCRLPFRECAKLIRRAPEPLERLLTSDRDRLLVRYQDPLLNYHVLLLHSVDRALRGEECCLVLDPFGHPLTMQADGQPQTFSSRWAAVQAADHHARETYGLKAGLTPQNKYEYTSLSGGEDYREWLLILPDYQPSHFTPHFTERNLLLHFRTKSRIDKSGRRLLFIEEIQSDWHQQARNRHRKNRWDTRIPDAPFRNEWLLLALKLLLQHLVAGGYEGLAWSPGRMQQMRYQSRSPLLEQIYDRRIGSHLLQLSRPWAGELERTRIDTREPWLTARRRGEHWYAGDSEGRFTTRKPLSKAAAVALCERHGRAITLEVSVFFPPPAMRRQIAQTGLPLFGEASIDPIAQPLRCHAEFNGCPAELHQGSHLELTDGRAHMLSQLRQ